MKRLLKHIKSELEERVDVIESVYVLQDPEDFPRSTKFPVVILSDNGEEPGPAAGGSVDELFVLITIIQKIYTDNREDRPMMGDTNNIGILDIYDEITDALETTEFGHEGDARYSRPRKVEVGKTESDLIDDSSHVQSKEVLWSWKKFSCYRRQQ